MNTTISVTVLIVIGIQFLSGCSLGERTAELIAQPAYSSNLPDDDLSKIRSLIKKFRSDDKTERESAQNEILALSQTSIESRQFAIQELLQIVNAQNDK